MKESNFEETMKEALHKAKEGLTKLGEKAKGLGKSFSKFDIKSVKLKAIDFKSIDLKKLKPTHKMIVDRKRFVLSLSAAVLALVILIYIVTAGTAYSVKVNGKEIAKVKKLQTIENVMGKLKQQFMDESKSEVTFASEVSFARCRSSKKNLINEVQLYGLLKKQMKYSVESYGIYINNNLVSIVKTKAAADGVLADIKAYYIKSMNLAKYKQVGFAEKVEIKKEFDEAAKIMEEDEAVNFLLRGTDEIKVHKIQSGESLWSIAGKYHMSMAALIKANSNINPDKVKIGQELNLIVPKPLISVKTVETITYLDQVPFDQKVEFSSTMFKDETNVKVRGECGQKQVTADIIKINGVEQSKKILGEKAIKAPKTQIIVKGTKNPPPKKGTGSFAMPSRGYLSSRFGMRWGRRHEGIDIAAPIGTPVKAADGGVVIFAGRESGYGKFIKIDHGGGYVSCYGHLSKISVKVGQKVYKGQKIGAVGNTGRSTGPHLHFEIRKNGVARNPLKFL